MKTGLWRVDDLDLSYVKEAIEKGLTGELTKRFETKFSEKFNTKYAIAVNSGTSALHTSMLALDIGPGDEVIVPPLTFIATTYAVLYVGATPVFADIESDTFNICPNSIEEKITSRTKAIISVSLYGLPSKMEKIINIAKEHNLKVIEDNAQCVLGEENGKIAGSVADMSIFSMQRSKHITSGDGGILVTNNEHLAEMARKYSDLGYKKLTAKPTTNEDMKEEIQQPDYKRHELIGYNFRMPEVCAAIGLAQLDKIDKLIEKRIEIASLYDEVVKDCDWLVPQYTPKNTKHSYWTYVVKLDASISWSKFREVFLKNNGKSFYGAWSISYLEPSLMGMKFPDSKLSYEKGLCPVAESLQPSLIQFKTNFESLEIAKNQASALAITIGEIDKIINKGIK
ncbi:DegT/DnrJ/EryC1/StrS family aminotransferase [bacterium]|nr:DegT/DnrJ/EryC1/StrS family aminotransferase [bacterium]